MADGVPGRWEKADIVLKALLPLVLAGIGLLISMTLNDVQSRQSKTLDEIQQRESDARLYTELMTKREEADTSLRRSMFESVLKTFLESRPGGSDRDILNLELLAYNFHETLNLKSLFVHVQRQIQLAPRRNAEELQGRLIKLATQVSEKEVRALEESGAVAKLDFDNPDNRETSAKTGMVSIEGHEAGPVQAVKGSLQRLYNLQLMDVERKDNELRLWLQVFAPGNPSVLEVNTTFNAGFFDFPMVENIRLSHGQRCAVVVTELGEALARVSLVFFPGSRASLKEKPYYDEVLDELVHTRKGLKGHQ